MLTRKARIKNTNEVVNVSAMRFKADNWLNWDDMEVYQQNDLEFIEMKRTAQQNKILHSLLAKLGISKEDKESLISKHTNGRTSTSTELFQHECENLMTELKSLVRGVDRDACDKKRKKLISLAYGIGWTNEQGKADMPRINKWCVKYGWKHKELNKYSSSELNTLLSQFERVVSGDYDKV